MENLKKFHVIIAYFISFVILSSSYVPVAGMYDVFSDDVEQAYKSTKISDYYNLIALLPIKLVNKFVANNIDIRNTVNKTASDKQNNKNKKHHNYNFDIAFTNNTVRENTDNFSFAGVQKFLPSQLKFNFSSYANYANEYSVFFIVIMLFFFRLSARGDTEDNIKNINIKWFRLG